MHLNLCLMNDTNKQWKYTAVFICEGNSAKTPVLSNIFLWLSFLEKYIPLAWDFPFPYFFWEARHVWTVHLAFAIGCSCRLSSLSHHLHHVLIWWIISLLKELSCFSPHVSGGSSVFSELSPLSYYFLLYLTLSCLSHVRIGCLDILVISYLRPHTTKIIVRGHLNRVTKLLLIEKVSSKCISYLFIYRKVCDIL